MKFGVHANFHSIFFEGGYLHNNNTMFQYQVNKIDTVHAHRRKNTSGELRIIVGQNQTSGRIRETIETQLPILNKISQCK